MTDLFSLAKQMADSIPESEKKKMQGMKMEDMIGVVSKNVMNMMNDKDLMNNINKTFSPPQEGCTEKERFVEDIEFSDSDDDVISPKTNDLLYTLNVKLEDLYNGKQKKISFKRKRFKKVNDDNGKDKYETFFEKKKIIVTIPPGTRDGHVIKFEKEADQLPGHDPGDVIITISEDEHETFDREGDNLFLIKNISLSEIYSLEYSFTHLNKNVVTIKSTPGDCLHLKDGIRKIVGLGMPIFGTDKKGDLFIRFNLILPEKIEDLDALKAIIPPLNNVDENASDVYTLEEVTDEDMEKLEEESESDEDEESESDEDEESESEDDDDDVVEEDDEEEENE